ncbi:MAG: hypothetical protein NTX50_17275 [Candidatus Sumerlaeota bacterium]|nr:hypothetical protein [Candidatus Sumerlaeota bacterium]
MKSKVLRSSFCVIQALMLAAMIAYGDEPAATLAEPWQSAYSGDNATGKHVLAFWKFEQGADSADASGHGHTLQLVGAQILPTGKFGGCLETFAGYPREDKPHRALVKNQPDLSPAGAFTIEMWIQPKPELEGYPESFLLDKKYVSNDDYQLILGDAQPSGERMLRMSLGFGESSSVWYSLPFHPQPGQWRHVAFVYDGAGTGSFVIDGRPHGSQTIPGRKAISAGKHGLSIGDRIGSLYHGFPGYLDEVRITEGAREFRAALIARESDRTCFIRMEPGAAMRIAIRNLQRDPLTGASVSLGFDGLPGAARKIALGALASGAKAVADFPIDTSLRPDVYRLRAALFADGATSSLGEQVFDVRIVLRRLPQFPVLMWGIYRDALDEAPLLKEMGFTHVLGLGADYDRIWKAGVATEPDTPERVAAHKKMLDECLAQGISVSASLSPGGWLRGKPEFLRVNQKGQPPTDKKKADICGLFPEIPVFCRNVGESVGKAYGAFPAFSGALIHTEVRDQASPCFHQHDREAFRKASGFDIPPGVAGSRGVEYSKIAGFPKDRVIPDQYPPLVYYRWYWKSGDGWNDLNTAVDRGIKTGAGAGRADLWTFHDPAVRAARVFGSGGSVDFISQWTYSYPDPIRIGLATDELLATAAGAARPQGVMKMTQIIWYRSQTAPAPKPGEPPLPFSAQWEAEQPDARFITIAPMHLREAFWTKIARPISGIMYHGWQSLTPCEPITMHGYRFTHPETRHELARLTASVLRPLGPALLALGSGSRKSDVAFLESFASEMFARRGTFGWGGGWAGDAYHAMQYAHLQPEIVLDETIAERGLDQYRVLAMFDCDVLAQSVCDRVKKFQATGGIVIGDERLAPAIKPDVLVQSFARTGRADQDKAVLMKMAGELSRKLDGRYTRYADSSNPEIIPYCRRSASTDYVFVVNDRREYGQYVGQHGIVMENGCPQKSEIRVRRAGGFVYDLVEHAAIPATNEGGALRFAADLGPCDGRVFMVTSRAIHQVECTAPSSVKPGETTRPDEKVKLSETAKPSDTVKPGEAVKLLIRVLDDKGQPIDAVIPLEIAIRDPDGRIAEFSGYNAAVDGALELKLDIAKNDTPGCWQIEVHELALNCKASATFRVLGPDPWPPLKTPPSKGLANPVQPQG